MILIKEEDIEVKPRILDGFEQTHLTNIIIKTRPPFDKQLKQQILDNQRDAKKLDSYHYEKQIVVGINPRIGVCSMCGDRPKKTNMHHTKYDPDNPLAYTIELCVPCHAHVHRLGRKEKE